MLRILPVLFLAACSEYEFDPDLTGNELPLDTGEPERAQGEVALECHDDYAEAMPWKRSELWFGDEEPTDAAGRPWFDDDFDDRSWGDLASLPDRDPLAEENDVFYRANFWLDEVAGRTQVRFVGNDGVWLYVNGEFVGHWGGEWREGGCINVDNGCGVNYEAPPADITEFLRPGHNHIAVMLTNGPQGFMLDIQPACIQE